jgi:hypothetical protein
VNAQSGKEDGEWKILFMIIQLKSFLGKEKKMK